MDEFSKKIIQLDSEENYQGILDYIGRENRDGGTVLFLVYQLLNRSRFQGAFLLARLLAGVGVQHPLVAFALAVRGSLHGDPAEEQAQTTALGPMIDVLAAAQQATFYHEIARSALFRVAEQAVARDDIGMLMRCLEIMKAATPQIRTIFDFSAKVVFDLEESRRQGRQQARLLEFVGPAPGSPRVERRVVVAVRRLVFPNKPDSRECEVGPRLWKAMSDYGWRTTFYGMTLNPLEDCRCIIEVCQRETAEVLIFDDQMIELPAYHPLRAAMVAELRRRMPELKIVALHLDPWALDPAVLIETASPDLIWNVSPSLPVWQHPAFADKLFQAPVPHGGYQSRPVAPLLGRMAFIGGIKGYNWHRALWRAASLTHQLSVDWQLTHHVEDNLPAHDSYMAYMKRLSDSACCINFAMRPDLSCVITGRTFETLASGGLLVQEANADMDYYLVSGEHYLSFSTFAELRAIARFLEADPEAAEDIRRRGNDFMLERFADERIVGYLARRLFHD